MLKINNLTIKFNSDNGPVTAIEKVSFHLDRGKTLAVVGESGSGKSVTSLAIMGLLPPNANIAEGEIVFEEENISINLLQLNQEEKRKFRGRKIAMIFQEPMTSLNPVYTCGNQVVEAIMLHEKLNFATAKQQTLKLFDEVKLPQTERIFNSYPHQISGGQKQRVMIAMALACNPSVLIADEPTTALDVSVQHSIVQLLTELQQRRGLSILFITHDLGLAASLAHDVLVLYRGKIMEYNTSAMVFHSPMAPYTQRLIACKPSAKVRKEWLPTVSDSEGLRPDFVSGISVYGEENILEVKNLSAGYTNQKGLFGRAVYHPILEDISFAMKKGSTLAVVGESGSGKTTLGKTILRLNKAFAGEVIYTGVDVLKVSSNTFDRGYRRRMQIIFQDPYSSLDGRQSIGKAIIEPMEVHNIGASAKERKDKALWLLEKTGLNPEMFARYPHEFSGGQRQRICIARALALDPEFIVCDEAVSALDVSVQAQILNLLKQLQLEFGLSYLFITHDLSVVRFIANDVLVLQQGRIMEYSDADALFASPKSDYTKILLEAIPEM